MVQEYYVKNGQLVTNVGTFPLDSDWMNASANATRFRKLKNTLQPGTPEYNQVQELESYWSTKRNIGETQAKFQRQDPNVPQNVYDVRMQSWQQKWEPRSAELEQLTIDQYGAPSKSQIDPGAFASYEMHGGDVDRLADAMGVRAQQSRKGRGFGRFMKTIVPLGAALIGGYGLTAALGGLGAGAAAGATGSGAAAAGTGAAAGTAAGGAAAGTAASSGLGSSLLTSGVAKGALIGGATGYIQGGDLKSALKGAALGGLTAGASDYVLSGGNVPGLGTVAGAPLSGGLQGPTQGSGLLGSLTRGASSLGLSTAAGGGSSLSGGAGGGNMLSSALKIGGSLYEKGQEDDFIKKQQGLLTDAQKRAQGMLRPYSDAGAAAQNQLSQSLTAGFNPGDLASDPGYQFRLWQGQQALQRQMAASGLGQSGAALKAATEYGQGLANQEYQDAYNRYLALNNQLANQANLGYGAAGQVGDYYSDIGSINAASNQAKQLNKNRTLSEILGAAEPYISRGFRSIFG